ncbi:MAG TPA: bifunctional diaminohydroxyphosphoribosylaminopyrimidine deaminase/5-amino-6-(5-phosphoribosylamino)uracil reductase RibD [Gammaproteobacteria bacterium]|nr:bifunctional diaminohydroxyphosphoribosylaminopyrimidine deaminase/5-amino-6-(5-phosphoribosylamino)uracil reductase RibD [Gammaproteobacteria bacterium]
MSAARDSELMARALRLAAKGAATTAPNPTVGCVLVQGDEIVGEGYTSPAGGPHAEIAALAAAGERAAGATAYVTLEPCCHTGRTGPCTEALIAARVARVVYAVADPNPLVGGGGAAALRAAGVEVEAGVLEAEAEAMNRGFFARMRRGRPWVRSKLAASLDGRTALADGASRWITGEAARRDVHRWRARSGAVLTGIGTLLRDDPSLTARPPGGSPRQPLRVIVDARLRTPPDAKTLSLPGQVVIFTTEAGAAGAGDAWRRRARVEVVRGAAHCDLAEALERLASLEVNDVWVEAGPGLNGALLEAGLIDELVVYLAPHILGDDARGMFSLTPLASLEERIELEIDSVRRIGRDLRIVARPMRKRQAKR